LILVGHRVTETQRYKAPKPRRHGSRVKFSVFNGMGRIWLFRPIERFRGKKS
jgi:hypothetical protein